MKSDLKVPTSIAIKKSALHGRGIFAVKNICEGEIIEECHYVLLAGDTHHDYPETPMFIRSNPIFQMYASRLKSLEEYSYFAKNENNKLRQAIVLGCGMIYNHNSNPNVSYAQSIDDEIFIFSANKAIDAGEELFVDYGPSYSYEGRGFKRR